MIKVDIEPNTPEWHEWRKGGIGGSDIAKIMGVSPFGTALDVYNEKAGFAPEKKWNSAMQRGNQYEPIVRDKFNKLYPPDMQFHPGCYQSIETPFFRVSFDGYNSRGKTLEIKIPNAQVMAMARQGNVPDYYNMQMQWGFLLCGGLDGFFVPYNPRTEEMIEVIVERDTDLIRSMEIAAIKFWNDFLQGIPPTKQKSDKDFIYEERLLSVAEEARVIKQELSKWEQKWEQIKKDILQFGNGRSFSGYGITATMTTPRTTYDIEAMKEDGIDVSKYQKTSEKSSFRITID